MKIIIEYESSWRNSFLDGSNDEELPAEGRNFVASMTELKKEKNYHKREVTKNTVMGILSRLIGDQRKLYQAKESNDYYFLEIEDNISFDDIKSKQTISSEIVYIRNMKGSKDKNSFTGMIKANDPIFQSEYSAEFWGVLGLDLEELVYFILDDSKRITSTTLELDPISIMNTLESIRRLKPLENRVETKQASDKLSKIFEKYKPLSNKGYQLILPMYCSALYLQVQRLEQRFDMSSTKSKMGGISGISHNGFTLKDFMARYTTGSQKKIYGNPFLREEFINGEGKFTQSLTKVSGQLEITIDIDNSKAIELKGMIENAGVSSFYLGKKGLAYVICIK